MKSYSDISLKYIKQNRKRSVLTIIGVTLAVILIFAVGTFGFSFFDSMIQMQREKSDFEFMLHDITKENADKIKDNVEVKDTSIEKDEKEEYSIKGTDRIAHVRLQNDDYYKKMYTDEIIEGEKPKSTDEVIIDSFSKEKLNLSLGDKITLVSKNNEEKEYKISGVSSFNGYATKGAITLNGYLDDSNYVQGDNYSVFINLKAEKGKQEIIKKVIDDADVQIKQGTRSDNDELLYLTGNGGSSAMGKSIKSMAAFVISIIVVCTVTVIYNSFNISVIERMRYFGVLKAIGATPKQIKNIIFKEGFLIGLIALPIGCLIGFFGLKFGIKIFIGDSFLGFMDNFKINFYPSVLLIAVALEAVTIFVSLIIPARKAKKVSAVDAMRNKNEIKIGKIKRRRGKLVQKIFGIEGSIAYKNIRRTPARFIVTIIALTISIVLFNVFYGFMDYAKQITMQEFINMPADSEVSKSDRISSFSDDEAEKIENLAFVEDYYKLFNDTKLSALDTSMIDSDYQDKTGSTIGKDIYNSLNYQQLETSTYVNFTDKDFELVDKYLDKKVNYDELDEGGVILVDGNTITNKNGKKEIVRMTKYKVGDTIKIPKTEDNSDEGIKNALQNGNFYEAKVLAITNIDPYQGGEQQRKIAFIFSEKGYEKINKKIQANGYLFKFDGDNDKRKEAANYFADNAESMGLSYMDFGDSMKSIKQIYGQVEFFVYCFIIIVTIISIVNIYNTISTSILIRKKEFSTLKAIGMTEMQLSKSVILEGTFYGIISAIIGGVMSVVLSKLMINLGGGLGTYEYHFPIIAFSLSIVAAILVTYLSTLVPLKKLKKLTIVEGIRDED